MQLTSWFFYFKILLEFELLLEGKIVPFEFIYPWKSLEIFGEEEVQLLYFQAWTSWNIGKGIIEVGFGPGHLNSVARMSSPAHRGGVIGLTPTPNWPKANVHLDSTSHPVIAPAGHRRTLAAAVLGTMPTGTHLFAPPPHVPPCTLILCSTCHRRPSPILSHSFPHHRRLPPSHLWVPPHRLSVLAESGIVWSSARLLSR
jgi:hypothetical protein